MSETQSGPRRLQPVAAQGNLLFPGSTRAAPPIQADGELRKLRALELLRARNPHRVREAQAALLRLLLTQDSATIDDVRRLLNLDGDKPARWLGSVPGELSRAGIIERAGYSQTSRAVAHARPVSVWRLRDRQAAQAWLAAHGDAGA